MCGLSQTLVLHRVPGPLPAEVPGCHDACLHSAGSHRQVSLGNGVGQGVGQVDACNSEEGWMNIMCGDTVAWKE